MYQYKEFNLDNNPFRRKGPTGPVTPCLKVKRHPENPILTAKDVSYKASYVFNAGVAKLNGIYYIAPRVDYCGNNVTPADRFSFTGFGTSTDGIHFTMEDGPVNVWYNGEKLDWVNDSRLTVLENELYLSFCFNTCHSERPGIAKWRGTGRDFDVVFLGIPSQRNMILCPFKTPDGLYMRMERPMISYGDSLHIWYSKSPDMRYWGDADLLLGNEDVPYANYKIGGGAPMLETRAGYLMFFHAVDVDPARTVKVPAYDDWCSRYTVGVALYSLDDPTKLIGITKQPIMMAEAPYETGNKDLWVEYTLFPCGAVLEDDETIRIYYGAGDWCTCEAETSLDALLAVITPCSRITDTATVPFLG